MKEYADKRHRARESHITIGDPVLVKVNNKTKADPPFEPKPLFVTKQNGTMLTAECNGREITRNASFFKPSPKQPDEVSSDEEEDNLIPEQAETPSQDPERQPQLLEPAQPAIVTPQLRPSRHRRLPAKFKDFIIS